MPINLEIDGQAVTVDNGATVMDAATKLGLFVPHFCYHKKLSIAANCRMCLVQVEKAPKPLPACATPATEGMKVQTHSKMAVDAQKGVMEFLLINHPLDCPICDQGGECQLQDLAVGYGPSSSRYKEEKRVVVNKNLGPLIATDMTRCIQCTRCVRFGQEVAGVMELGMAGRGEHAEIVSFVGRTVDSELSGNMIDLCPVGALTSKPFRYTARNWELAKRKSISPHDSLNSNLLIQVKVDRVMRTLPLESDQVNECWISDRDRFAYEGLDSNERLLHPMVKRAGQWAEVDWPEALDAAAQGLKAIAARHGAQGLGVLLAPDLTLEELHLGARLGRGLGTPNIDHRVRQSDFRVKAQGAPWLGMKVSDLSGLESVLLVGSTIRKEQPLIANRIRQAAKKGTAVHLVHVADDELLMPIAGRAIAKPSELAGTLAAVAAAVAQATGKSVRGELKRAITDAERAIAASLVARPRGAILLGHYAQQHPDFAVLLAIAQEIGRITGATVGVLPDGGNAVGAHLVGAVPAHEGLDARAMFEQPRAGYLVAGVELELDMGPKALAALARSEFAVVFSAYRNATTDAAQVMLPITPFTETAGTLVNMEGRVQSFNAVVKPQGDARPLWKVLRMLGAMLEVPGFHPDRIEDVRDAIAPDLQAFAQAGLGNPAADFEWKVRAPAATLERIDEFATYGTDPVVRRSLPLQRTADMKAARSARFHPATASSMGIAAGTQVRVRQGAGEAVLPAMLDAAVPQGAVRIARGVPETAALGEGEVAIDIVKVPAAA
ncbi:MAG TPA: NADH-quinone oxidoreductase subunit NuoG [Usitatibacter sp.]|jgi:NADH-quinone oxidoreductase subunit G|nr:NADH-quinone oxidoreductase subunit NuoG [Usitatibacter sp.]